MKSIATIIIGFAMGYLVFSRLNPTSVATGTKLRALSYQNWQAQDSGFLSTAGTEEVIQFHAQSPLQSGPNPFRSSLWDQRAQELLIGQRIGIFTTNDSTELAKLAQEIKIEEFVEQLSTPDLQLQFLIRYFSLFPECLDKVSVKEYLEKFCITGLKSRWLPDLLKLFAEAAPQAVFHFCQKNCAQFMFLCTRAYAEKFPEQFFAEIPSTKDPFQRALFYLAHLGTAPTQDYQKMFDRYLSGSARQRLVAGSHYMGVLTLFRKWAIVDPQAAMKAAETTQSSFLHSEMLRAIKENAPNP